MMICGSGQLGGDSSSDLRMIGLHRLGEVGSAWVKTWQIRQFQNKDNLDNLRSPVSSAYQSTVYLTPSGP